MDELFRDRAFIGEQVKGRKLFFFKKKKEKKKKERTSSLAAEVAQCSAFLFLFFLVTTPTHANANCFCIVFFFLFFTTYFWDTRSDYRRLDTDGKQLLLAYMLYILNLYNLPFAVT